MGERATRAAFLLSMPLISKLSRANMRLVRNPVRISSQSGMVEEGVFSQVILALKVSGGRFNANSGNSW